MLKTTVTSKVMDTKRVKLKTPLKNMPKNMQKKINKLDKMMPIFKDDDRDFFEGFYFLFII